MYRERIECGGQVGSKESSVLEKKTTLTICPSSQGTYDNDVNSLHSASHFMTTNNIDWPFKNSLNKG